MAAAGHVSAPAPQDDSWAHFAVIMLVREDPQGGCIPTHRDSIDTMHDLPREGQAWQTGHLWQTACRRLTSRVEDLSPTRALLDVGTCTDAEALDAIQGLLAYLARWDLPARAGIAPSGCLAELALLRAPAHVMVRRVSPDGAAALLSTTPVTLLPQLRVAGIVDALSPAVIERLHRYGLRMLGQVGRLGELAVCRQFGTAVGRVLAALAVGHDPRPLSPTPLPASLRVRLRMPVSGDALAPEQVPAVLAHFAEQIAGHLHVLDRQARTLHLTISWETGAQQCVTYTLQQPTYDPAHLLGALQRLLVPLLARAPGTALTDLHLTLTDFAPVTPEQAAFWRTRAQRLTAIERVADTLTRRHGKPLLLAPQRIAPDAIFPEDRHALCGLSGLSELTVPDAALAPPAAPAAAAAPAASSRDAWQDVPLRLHWW